MPARKLEDSDRRELTLRALSGENVTELAKEYGVSRSHVYKLQKEAEENAQEEAKFWDEVCQRVGRTKEGK